jgi:hypothetical protein
MPLRLRRVRAQQRNQLLRLSRGNEVIAGKHLRDKQQGARLLTCVTSDRSKGEKHLLGFGLRRVSLEAWFRFEHVSEMSFKYRVHLGPNQRVAKFSSRLTDRGSFSALINPPNVWQSKVLVN